MNATLKKILIISGSALGAAALATAAVLIILKAGAKATGAGLNDSSAAVLSAKSDNGIRLAITEPKNESTNVTEPDFTFSGTSDPAAALTVNGTAVQRDSKGAFTYGVTLNIGENIFTFEHKGEKKVYKVNYRYVIIESYSPSSAQTYPCGSTLVVSAAARKGSEVTAKFNGEVQKLTAENNGDGEKADFVSYNGVFKLPENNAKDLNLGKIVFSAAHNGKSESFSSGDITCKKSDVVVDYDPAATPTGGKYMNVGSGYIAEIAVETAETFDGNVSTEALKNGSVDWSRPTNNYLPRGTVDYCSPNYVIYEAKGNKTEYVTLRAGYRVYKQKKDKPYTDFKQVTKQYVGKLPDHNEIRTAAFENNGTHTVLTLDTNWKAPFYFDILPQTYVNPATQNYSVTDVTFQYIDITFCYATVFEGEISVPEDNPIFKGAQVIKNMNADKSAVRDYTLRLYLKKQGGFYGWDCEYNSKGQLVFTFLNPKKIAAADADNEYRADLNGAKILIDVGHGGKDSGALHNGYKESEANLKLAYKIKAELEKAGARVIMTRTSDTVGSCDEKTAIIKREKPDYCVAVHHDSSADSGKKGFGSYYSNVFSKRPSEFILAQTKNSTSVYSGGEFTFKWHYYFMCRQTVCPVVLTENGYMSNSADFATIKNEAANTEKAKAITRGIVDYFNSIQ